MKRPRPVQRLRFFEDAPNQQHIGGSDTYLYAPPDISHRLGIIGLGTMGQEHLRVSRLIGRAPATAVYDPYQPSIDAALIATPGHQQPAIHHSLSDILTDPQLDGFIICTPNHTHLEVLSEVIAAGKPVLLEKPMATSLTDVCQMMTMAQEYSNPVRLGLQYRYKAGYIEAWHELKERHTIGKLHTLSIAESRPPFLDKVGQWNKFNAKSGGTLVEKCCHYFDLMIRYAGSIPTRVFASGGQAVNFTDFDYEGATSDIDDHAFIIVEFANGVRGQFTLNMFAPLFRETLTATGELGQITATEEFDPQRPQARRTEIAVETIEPSVNRLTELSYGNVIEQSGHGGATYHEHLAFIDLMAGRPCEVATLAEAAWSLVVATAAQQSMILGQPISIDDLLEEHKLMQFLHPQG